jgi:WD repeat-containing protein 40A
MQLGAGHLVTDRVWEEHFEGAAVYSAAYTHCWDPSGTRLFAAGGPLPFGLRGCYMGLWQR